MAVAAHLLDPAVSPTPMASVESETKETEVKEEPRNSRDTGANVSQIQDDPRCGISLGDIYRLVFRHFTRWHQLPLLPR